MDNNFVIITTVYNSVNYIEQCLASIESQVYDNFSVVVVDDYSTDETWNKVLKFNYPPFIIHKNNSRNGSALWNIVKVINRYATDKEDVICLVDGDDALTRNNVLSELNEAYQDENVYMTYGQFIPMSGTYPPYCKHVPDTRTHRVKGQWYVGHLRTFKVKLWDAINDDDLRDDDGKYYTAGGDGAYLYPMVEICGHKHMRFIEKVNYLYNDLNPLNDMKVNVKHQLRVADKIQHLPSYKEVDKL